MTTLQACVEALTEKQWQSATELAHAIGKDPSVVSSILYQNIWQDAQVKVKRRRRQNLKETWEYSTYQYQG